jgi:hypothetical protein
MQTIAEIKTAEAKKRLEELQSHEDNIKRWLWISAGDITERTKLKQ